MAAFNPVMATEKALHRCASKSSLAARGHPVADEEDDTTIRSKFARDRDRILYCKAFRRLAHKTQVYLSTEASEHMRTRLTHTVEVASIAKNMAVYLGMNQELTEAIAFGHDIGHSPFGHAGERQLDDLLMGKEPLPERLRHRMRKPTKAGRLPFGNFKHSFQSVRQLIFIEHYDDTHDGMNITDFCLEGILKHTKLTRQNGKPCVYPTTEQWDTLALGCPWPASVEGQIVAVADEIAQVSHDLGDALDLRVIDIDDVLASLVKLGLPQVKSRIEERIQKVMGKPRSIYRNIVNMQAVGAIIDYYAKMAYALFQAELDQIPDEDGQWQMKKWLLPGGTVPDKGFARLRQFKDDAVLNNYPTNRMDDKGQLVIRQLADAYVVYPPLLPDTSLSRFLLVKKRELKTHGKAGFVEWFDETEERFGIRAPLSKKDREELLSLVESQDDGIAIRKLRPALLNAVTPYLAVDGDFRRCIVDHIAGMTDAYAEGEARRLHA